MTVEGFFLLFYYRLAAFPSVGWILRYFVWLIGFVGMIKFVVIYVLVCLALIAYILALIAYILTSIFRNMIILLIWFLFIRKWMLLILRNNWALFLLTYKWMLVA
jgi:hypothetical protein